MGRAQLSSNRRTCQPNTKEKYTCSRGKNGGFFLGKEDNLINKANIKIRAEKWHQQQNNVTPEILSQTHHISRYSFLSRTRWEYTMSRNLEFSKKMFFSIWIYLKVFDQVTAGRSREWGKSRISPSEEVLWFTWST